MGVNYAVNVEARIIRIVFSDNNPFFEHYLTTLATYLRRQKSLPRLGTRSSDALIALYTPA